MLKVYELPEAREWDKTVYSFKRYDVYYLSGYVKAFQIHGDGEPLLFYYEGRNTRGINVVMKRDIGKDGHFTGKVEENQFFDFATPYGYGGWLIEGTGIENLLEEYTKWCEKNKIISEFVRFHPVLENHMEVSGIYEITPCGKTIIMDLSSQETIWGNMISKNRNMVRKAQKNEVRIYNGRCPELYKEFRAIYNGTMDRDSAEKYYYFEEEFYRSVLEDLPWNSQIFYAVFKEKVVAASIMLMANGRMNYHLSGSVKEYGHLAPTNLLLFEAALWGCANGYRTLYLGGGVGSGEDSLFKFKRAFYRGEKLNRFYVGRKIFDREMYDKLIGLRSEFGFSFKTGYFPAYRS